MRNQVQNILNFLRGFALLCGFLLGMAGCVDIHDAKVQVQRPEEVDPYGRNVLNKCPPHINPHRLVTGQTGSNSVLAQAGSAMVYAQAEFDHWWSYLSAVDSGKVATSSLSQEPVVNWTQEMVYFLVVTADNSCQKAKPYGDEMTTDCYSIQVPIYRYNEGTNCQPAISDSVFVYIFPKTPWSVSVQWVYPTAVPTLTPKPTAAPTATPTPTPTGEDE